VAQHKWLESVSMILEKPDLASKIKQVEENKNEPEE
jgi:hypothetical protein